MIRVCGILLLMVGIAGCAFSEPRARPNPVLYTPADAPNAATISSDTSVVQFSCAEKTKKSFLEYVLYPFITWSALCAPPQCIYKTTDQTKLENLGPANVAPVVMQLLNASDENCDNFLENAFDANASLGVAKRTLNNSTSGTNAITAFVSAPATAGLSLGNLVFSNLFDAFSQEYYAGQTAPFIAAAILNWRSGRRKEIEADAKTPEKDKPQDTDKTKVKDRTPYTIQDGIRDVVEYDNSCSFEFGLRQLAEKTSLGANRDRSTAGGERN